MRKSPFIAVLIAYIILALSAALLVGPMSAYAEGNGPTPPTDPSPPPDTTVSAVDLDFNDQEDGSANVDPKQDVSLWQIAQLFVIAVI